MHVILELLAADPRTPTPTLIRLAADPHLPALAALALATNPALAPDVPVPALRAAGTATWLRDAIRHPGLSPARRAFILEHAESPWRAIAECDDFTAEEITAVYRSHPPVGEELFACLRNAHTPRRIAAEAAALAENLFANPADDAPTAFHALALEAGTVRHRLPAATARAAAALAADDPDAAYSRALLAHGTHLPLGPDTDRWWGAAIHAYPCANFAAAAVAARPELLGASMGTHLWDAFSGARLPNRYVLLAAAAPDLMGDRDPEPGWAMYLQLSRAAATAPDELIPALALTSRFEARSVAMACENVHASAATLGQLHAHLRSVSDSVHELSAREGLATHPHATPELRAAVLGDGEHRGFFALARHLDTYGDSAQALLDCPYWAFMDTLAPGHGRLWAARALRGYDTTCVTPDALAPLAALEHAGFAGTLRELLDSARSLSI